MPANPARLQQKLALVRAACERADRDFSQLELSLEIQVLVAPTEAEVKERTRAIANLPASKRGEIRHDILDYLRSEDGRPLHASIDDWLVGTPGAVAEQLATYQQRGISHFMLWFLDFPSLQGLSLFASQVKPALRAVV